MINFIQNLNRLGRFMKKMCLLFLFLVASMRGNTQTDSVFLKKVALILEVTRQIDWPETHASEEILLAYLGNSPRNFSMRELNKVAASKGVKLRVQIYSGIKTITHQPQVLWIEKGSANILSEALKEYYGKPVLIISENSSFIPLLMMHFQYYSSNNYSFRYNKALMTLQQLKWKQNFFSDLLISELSIVQLWQYQYEQINYQEEIIRQLKRELHRQLQAFQKQHENFKKTEKLNNGFENENMLNTAEADVKNAMSDEILGSEEISYVKKEYLKQQRHIQAQMKDIEMRNQVLSIQSKEINIQKSKIEQQNNVLSNLNRNVSWQKSILYVITALLVLSFVLAFWALINNRKIRKFNALLSKKNQEMEQQRQSMIQTTQNLENLNQELEKLSIVAAKTDNSIMLISPNGIIEWVNSGFERLYGKNLDELFESGIFDIFSFYNSVNIKEIFYHAINKQESVHFEAIHKFAGQSEVFTRTTLSPVLNHLGYLHRLVTIDTDISDMRKAEQEISSQAFELREISDMLVEQKRMLELKNENISASIRSAQSIQSSILPLEEELNQHFETFILFRPKEIVSGDFYWYAQMEKEGKKLYFFAAADCSGHGVPGAFMSLIGFSLLNEIVHIDQLYEPKEILRLLDKKFQRALRQSKTDYSEGMDVSFLRITVIKDNPNPEVCYSGARRNLYIANLNEDSIKIIPGNKRKIGDSDAIHTEIFLQEEIICQSNTIFYLSSDGFIDQSNPARKRYGSKRFVNTLSEMKNLEMCQQKVFLEKSLDNYMQLTEQRDDITILAIKIK